MLESSAARQARQARDVAAANGRPPGATIGQRAALPTRRTMMSAEEREEAVLLLRRYYSWIDSGGQDDRWLASGVGQCQRWDAPRVRTSAPASRAPAPAAPADDGDVALLTAIHEYVQSRRRTSQRIMRWKVRGEYRDGRDRPLTNEQIGTRLGVGGKKVAALWRALVIEFINAIVPGVSSGWANPERPIAP